MKILLVEDEVTLGEYIKKGLTEAGFLVDHKLNGLDGYHALMSETYNVIIMDVMLPDISGFELVKNYRAAGHISPVLFLTAKDDLEDRIKGIEIGGDDYLTKPFSVPELLARIRAVLRRQANELPGAPSQEEAVIAFGKFKLNLGTREMFREDEPMPLTSGEFAVLKALVSHPREPLSRDKLMNLARGREYSAMERSIDVQISRLRRMVEEDPAHPRYIQTVWGLGYVFVPDGSKA